MTQLYSKDIYFIKLLYILAILMQPLSHSSQLVPSSTRSTNSIDPFSMAPYEDSWAMAPMARNMVQKAYRDNQLMNRCMEPILKTDILDMGDHYEIDTELPGVPKSALDVVLGNGYITIKGDRKKSYTEEDIWGNHLVERSHGKVSRTLSLPPDADTANSSASFEEGVLKVNLPKLNGNSVGFKKLVVT